MSQNKAYRYLGALAIYIFMQFSSILLFVFNPFTAFHLIPEGYTTEQANQFIKGQWGFYSFLTATILIVWLTYQDFFKKDTQARMSGDRLFLWTIGGIFMAYGAQIISGLILTQFMGVTNASENTSTLIDIAKLTPIFIPVICIFAPILEEIIFRGILFKVVSDKTNFIIGVLFSSFVFAFIHDDFTFFISYFMMGFVFSFLYHKTNRLIVPIVAHATMNTFVVVIQLVSGNLIQDIQGQLQIIFF